MERFNRSNARTLEQDRASSVYSTDSLRKQAYSEYAESTATQHEQPACLYNGVLHERSASTKASGTEASNTTSRVASGTLSSFCATAGGKGFIASGHCCSATSIDNFLP